MAIAPYVARRVADAILEAMPKEKAVKMLDALSAIDGGQSFNDSVKMVRDLVSS